LNKVYCPNCGQSYYGTNYSTTTALGWTQIYKDGKALNCNPNTTTTYCTCCNCKHNFHYEEQYGEIYNITDDGLPPEVPVLEMSSITEIDLTTPVYTDMVAKGTQMKNSIQLPTMADIEDIKARLAKLEARVY
jgi:hypothetical protein